MANFRYTTEDTFKAGTGADQLDPAMVGGALDAARTGTQLPTPKAPDASGSTDSSTTTRYSDTPAASTTDPVADYYKTIKDGSAMPDEARRQALRAQAQQDVQTQLNAIDAAYNTLISDERARQAKKAEQGAAQVSGINRLSGLGGSSVASARSSEQAAAAAEVERQAVEALQAKQAIEKAQAVGASTAAAEARYAKEQDLALQREKEYSDWLTTQAKTAKEQAITLSPGESAYNAKGDLLAHNPANSSESKPITLSEGDVLVDATGKEIARGLPKKGSGSGGGGGANTVVGPNGALGLDAEAQYYYDNPSLLSSVTPTKAQQIIKAFSKAGVKFDPATLEKVNGGTRDTIAKFDGIVQRAKEAQDLVGQVNTGPISGRLGSLKQALGNASPEFSAYKFAIADMNSVLLNLRSGAAVSPSEYERIKGMIPLINEDEKTAAQKIPLFVAAIDAARKDYIVRSTQTTKQLMDSVNTSPDNPPATADFSVRTPDGQLHVFHDQASLDGFKKAAGL